MSSPQKFDEKKTDDDLEFILDRMSESLNRQLASQYASQGNLSNLKGLRLTRDQLESYGALNDALVSKQVNVVFWLLDQGLEWIFKPTRKCSDPLKLCPGRPGEWAKTNPIGWSRLVARWERDHLVKKTSNAPVHQEAVAL